MQRVFTNLKSCVIMTVTEKSNRWDRIKFIPNCKTKTEEKMTGTDMTSKYISKLPDGSPKELITKQKNLCMIVFQIADYIYRKHSQNYVKYDNDDLYEEWLKDNDKIKPSLSTKIINERECQAFLNELDKKFDKYSNLLAFTNLQEAAGQFDSPVSYVKDDKQLKIFNFHEYIKDLTKDGKLKSVEEIENIDTSTLFYSFGQIVNACHPVEPSGPVV